MDPEKVDDDQADARRNPVSTEKKSVLTGRTMKEIQKDAEKMADLSAEISEEFRELLQKEAQPDWMEPMLAKLTHEVFSDEEWIYERKLDGERCLVFKKREKKCSCFPAISSLKTIHIPNWLKPSKS